MKCSSVPDFVTLGGRKHIYFEFVDVEQKNLFLTKVKIMLVNGNVSTSLRGHPQAGPYPRTESNWLKDQTQ